VVKIPCKKILDMDHDPRIITEIEWFITDIEISLPSKYSEKFLVNS